MRSSVATGALRDVAQQVGALQAGVNRAALDVPSAVLEVVRPLSGAEVAPAVEQLAQAVAGALCDLADALLGLRRELEAAAEAQTNALYAEPAGPHNAVAELS